MSAQFTWYGAKNARRNKNHTVSLQEKDPSEQVFFEELVEAGGIEPPSETRLAQVSTSVAPTTFLASRPRRSWVRPANHLNVPPTPAALAESKPAWFMPRPSPAGTEGATGA